MPPEQNDWLEAAISTGHNERIQQLERARDAREILDAAMAHIDPEDRQAVVMVHLEGYSVKEAAAALNWTEGNLKVRCHRARLRLREVLQAMLPKEKGCHV